MKIVILRGGGATGRPGHSPRHGAGRDRGVTAIGDDQGHWLLLNMSSAVALQLERTPALAQHAGLLDGGVRALLLSDAQVDQVGGLLSLRGGAPIELYATPTVFEAMTSALPVLPVLQHYCGVHWHVVPVAGDRLQAQFQVEGMPSLRFTAIATRTPPPAHLGRSGQGAVGDSIALAVHDLASGRRAFCAPGLRQFGPAELDWMRQADCLLIDSPAHGDGVVAAAPPDGSADAAGPADLGAMAARHKLLYGPPCGAAPTPQPAWAALGFSLAQDGQAITL